MPTTDRLYGYWITLQSGKQGYYESHTPKDALLGTAVEGSVVVHADTLPYPANPIFQKLSGCPAFCSTPQQCKGKTACPKRYACSE